MQALDHVSITVRDLDRARPFYDAIMTALGIEKGDRKPDAAGYGKRNRRGDDGNSYLSVYQSDAAAPDPRRHWCFRAQSQEQVKAFHAAGLATGGRDAGTPGFRSIYHLDYFAA